MAEDGIRVKMKFPVLVATKQNGKPFTFRDPARDAVTIPVFSYEAAAVFFFNTRSIPEPELVEVSSRHELAQLLKRAKADSCLGTCPPPHGGFARLFHSLYGRLHVRL